MTAPGGLVSAAADVSVRRGLLELRMQRWSGGRTREGCRWSAGDVEVGVKETPNEGRLDAGVAAGDFISLYLIKLLNTRSNQQDG